MENQRCRSGCIRIRVVVSARGSKKGYMGISMGKRAPNSMNTTGDDNDSIYIYKYSANDDGREKPVHHNKKRAASASFHHLHSTRKLYV